MSHSRQIGFISTRFAGTDGVSLETAKWATVLERMGHACFYFCGECDRPPQQSFVVPEAFYRHPSIDSINQAVFSGIKGGIHGPESVHPEKKRHHKDFFSAFTRSAEISKQVQDLKVYLKESLYQFAKNFDLEALIVENALTIPVNLPLGLAITEFIAETGFPVIAHHHDFYWERQRFINNSVRDYLAAAFPPNFPSIHHVVINSVQAYNLASRIGVAGMVIPNVMDFDSPPPPLDEYSTSARTDLGVKPGQYLILQPTRIIQRKSIEHAIELIRRLELPAELVISHAAGDEGTEYEKHIHEFAEMLDVAVKFESDIVDHSRGFTPDGRKIYSLADIYPQSDLITYPSTMEGFGNGFLEAIYFKRPIVVNNYSIFEADIKPKGFHVIEFNGFIDEQTLNDTRFILTHPEVAIEQCEHNFTLGRRYYSYSVLERRLKLLLSECFGEII